MNFPTKDLGELAFHRRCAYERNWENAIIKNSPYAFVDKIIDKFHVTRTAHTPASVSTTKKTQIKKGVSEVDVP
ncbi:unnamed protein product [Sphacelaria rigidula]